MSIPTSPTLTGWHDAIARTLKDRAHAQSIVDSTDVALSRMGRQMIDLGATRLEVLTALNGGTYPEEDDPHSVWWQLEAWGVVSS